MGGVMVNLAQVWQIVCSNLGQVKPKTMKLVSAASLLSM